MKKGKHVYCQKPLTHTIYEARRLAEIARETGLATQIAVANQASESTRLLCEWIWSGAIGPVREVKNWSSRPFWPQGVERPKRNRCISPLASTGIFGSAPRPCARSITSSICLLSGAAGATSAAGRSVTWAPTA